MTTTTVRKGDKVRIGKHIEGSVIEIRGDECLVQWADQDVRSWHLLSGLEVIR